MAKKSLKAVFSLVVALMFVLQTVPLYSFAESGLNAADNQTTAADDNNSSELNYMIDENGNQVELTDEMREEIYSDDDTSGLYAADSENFFQYDDGEVELAADYMLNETFDGCTEGDTTVPGWTFKSVSKNGFENTSTISVEESSNGNALKLVKNLNGAFNKTKPSGDEALYAVANFNAPLAGKVVLSSDVYVDKAARFGMFFYSKCDDLDAAISMPTEGIPYLGRSYFWDKGADDVDPATVGPNGIITYDNNAKKPDTSVPWNEGQWYTFTFDIDTESGVYSFTLTDENENVVTSVKNLKLTESLIANDKSIYGLGFTIQNDVKTLGSVFVKNVKAIDNNTAEADANAVSADSNALALPEGVDAEKVMTDFDLPVKGQFGSDITWTSSNSSIASVDLNGHVTITRPEFTGAGSVGVILTATVTKGLASAERSISFDVLEQTPSNPKDKVAADKAMLELPETLKQSMVEADFEMPITEVNGSKISYTSSNSSIASIDNTTGKVTINKPPFTGSGTQSVVITATISNSGASDTKEFTIEVKELDPSNDDEKAIYDANNALIGGIDITNVRQESFYLSDKGSYGSLSWAVGTGGEKYIEVKPNYTTEDKYDEDGNLSESVITGQDGYKAVVTRPERNEAEAKVILTVTSNVNGKTATKDFELTVIPQDELKAYPGVEGYGAYSKGGRGGQVYHVTNLSHDGYGSLTYGLEQIQGARTIVFDVGGVIDLTALGRPITIKGEKYSNVTVAGQTAPYPGITLKGYGLTVNSAHDVIIRNIKIRIGGVLPDNEYYQSDPMSIGASKRVVVDHCTFHWAIDMDFRITGEYVTVTNTIMGKSLLANSPHEKGGHAYVGMINEGARKVTFSKNLIGDSTQRSPRITDADWVDSYNCLLYNCGNGYDLYNYEWQDKNAKMNVYNNYAEDGPSLSNATPYRMGRGRDYSGGILAYFKGNTKGNVKNKPSAVNEASGPNGIKEYKLRFGTDNGRPGTAYDQSNITLDEWVTNPVSYDNNGKKSPAASFTYMTYPFPAPRGDVMDVVAADGSNNILNYALDEDNGMGATKPARDLYDTMIMKEVKLGGTAKANNLTASLDESVVAPFFKELEKRTGLDYSQFKEAREWKVKQGEGPTLKGAASTAGDTKPVKWDNYTDTNINNPNYDAKNKYDSSFQTKFEVGDWWGQFCGSPGQATTYTLYDTKLDRTVKTTNPDYDQTRYELVNVNTEYVATERTVSDLFPTDWMVERDARNADVPGYKSVVDFLNAYRNEHYPYTSQYKNFDAYCDAKIDGKLAEFDDYDTAYTSRRVTWDGMGDGIPNWYKEYRGWSTSKYLSSAVNPETGYTYLEEYLQFMADDKPLNVDDTPASIENFKVNNLGYSTAQVFWNTDYRTQCVLEYGTEPGNYTKSEVLDYDETTDYYHTYHARTLVDLDPDTQYYYKVTATDENSNVTVAEYDPNDDNMKNMTFKTSQAPEGASDILPSKPTVTNTVPYLNQVRLNWTGDVATDESYEIYYDTEDHGRDYNSYAHKISGIDARNNKFIVTGLDNGKTYYFVVVAANNNGKTAADVVSCIPTGTLFDFDFTKMTEAEKDEYMKKQFMYILGGSVTMQQDPDTGENVLQMLDETNSHGVNADLKFAMTQDEKFTYEVKMKVLYQKQTDALNKQSNVAADGLNEHNTFQINFYKDALVSEDKDSTNSALWESAFSFFFDSQSDAIKESNGRFDGTVETGTLKFASTPVGNYISGRTPGKEFTGERAFPKGTGYAESIYKYTTKYGDAKYSDVKDTDKTLHGIWYYEKGSAKFVTYKFVVDPLANNVRVYADGVPVYESGEFSEDIEEPYNVGKVQLKSRNDGFSWVNIASLKAYAGDGKGEEHFEPVPPGIISGTNSGGGGPVMTPNPTATPAASEEPNASADPTASAEPTQVPASGDTNKYFDDLGTVPWAVESINTLAEKGIVTGTADRQFSPNANVTRAEFVTMLMRAYGDNVTAAEVQFSDVSEGEWYYEPIAKAAALGTVTGYDNGAFGINDNISREDMMVMAYRTMNALNIAVPKSKDYENFSDQSEISDYANEAIEAMYCAGIINGVGDNRLDPKGNADRAQSAKIIYGLTNMEGTVNE